VNCGSALISFLIARYRFVKHATSYATILTIIFYAYFLFIKNLDNVNGMISDNTHIKLPGLIIVYAVITRGIYKYANL